MTNFESALHLAQLPQGQPERVRRAKAMLEAMAAEGFGGCSSNAVAVA